MKRLTPAGVLFVCLPALAQADDALDAAVLRRIPDRAGLALIVPSVAAFEEGVAEFGMACSLVEIRADDLPNGLMTSSAGVQRDGTLVVAGVPADPIAWVLICRLEDEPVWRAANGVEPAGPADADEHPRVFRTRFGDADGFGAIRDSVLMLADRESSLQAALDSEGRFASELDARRRGLLDPCHAMVLVDVAAWRDAIEQRIALADALAQAAFMMSGGPQARPHIEFWRELSRAARSVVWQASSAAAAVRIDRDGARVRAVVSFPADSSIGESLAGVRSPTDDPLRGLPSGEFALAAGCDLRPEPLARLSGSAARWVSSLCATGAPSDALSAAWRDVAAANVLITADQDHPALVVGGVAATDAEGVRSAAVEALRSASWTRRNETVGQVAVDVASPPEARVEGPPDVATRAARAVLGDASELRIAAADGRALFCLGEADSAAGRMRKMAAGEGAPLCVNTRVRRAVDSLPKSPHALLLIDAGPTFALTVRAAQAFGAPIPALPLHSTYAPLIPAGAWFESGGVRAELLLPSATVREMIDSLRPGSAADRAY